MAQKAMYGRKGTIERYFFSRVPAIYELFNWAEKQDGPITDEHLREAVGEGLTTSDRDGNATDHTQALNCAMWGFLSNACRAPRRSSSKPMFLKASKPGDAWSDISTTDAASAWRSCETK